MPYTPNDANITPAALAYLHSPEGRPLLDQVTALQTQSSVLSPQNSLVSQIAALRKHFPLDAIHAALTLAQLQPKLRQKFPTLAHTFIYGIPEALEQSTDSAVAAHKANRFANALPAEGGHILDLCSGLGGDALALASIASTTAIDLSEPRLTCLRYNLESAPTKFPLQTQQADVTKDFPFSLQTSDFNLSNTLFHIDPARRSNGKRSAHYEDLIPGPDFLQKLIATFPGGAIKLSPAVDFDTLPMAGIAHLEIISHDKTVVQAVLWTGTLAKLFPPNTRTATIFKNHQRTFTLTATPGTNFSSFSLQTSAFTLPSFLYEADPVLTRSQLAAPLADSLNLPPLTSDAGYLLGRSDLLSHPALTPFQLLQILPYSEKKLQTALQNLFSPPSKNGPTAAVEVKTRGRLPGIDTDHLQKILSANTAKPPGNTANPTVFIFRNGSQTTQITAAITHRLTQTP